MQLQNLISFPTQGTESEGLQRPRLEHSDRHHWEVRVQGGGWGQPLAGGRARVLGCGGTGPDSLTFVSHSLHFSPSIGHSQGSCGLSLPPSVQQYMEPKLWEMYGQDSLNTWHSQVGAKLLCNAQTVPKVFIRSRTFTFWVTFGSISSYFSFVRVF